MSALKIPALFALILCTATLQAQESDLSDYCADFDFAQESEIVEFLLFHKQVPYSKIAPKNGGTITYISKKSAVKADLDKLAKHFGYPPPYPILETQEVIEGIRTVGSRPPTGSPADSPEWKRSKVLLRSKPSDIGDKKNASGAKADFLKDNSSAGQERWSTSGALIIQWAASFESPDKSSTFLYTEQSFGPSIYWNVIDTNAVNPKNEIEELQFAFPYKFDGLLRTYRHGEDDVDLDSESVRVSLERLIYTATPYYHTDFDFDGATVGARMGVEPVIDFGGFAIGKYQGLTPNSEGTKWYNSLAYRVRIAPQLAYDKVAV